jgi:hypothetical protein
VIEIWQYAVSHLILPAHSPRSLCESGQSLHLACFMAGGAGQHEVAILNKDVKSLFRSTKVAGTLQDKHYL